MRQIEPPLNKSLYIFVNAKFCKTLSTFQHSNGHSFCANFAIGLTLGLMTTVAVLNLINAEIKSDQEEATSSELEVFFDKEIRN